MHNHQPTDIGLDGRIFTVRYDSGCPGCDISGYLVEQWVIPTLLEARDRIAEAELTEHLSYTLPNGQRVVGGISRVPGPTDAELREDIRNDRELMRDEHLR